MMSAVSQRWPVCSSVRSPSVTGIGERLSGLVEQATGAGFRVGADGELEPRAFGAVELKRSRPAANAIARRRAAPEDHRLADCLRRGRGEEPLRPSAAGSVPRPRPDLDRSGIDRARQLHRDGERAFRRGQRDTGGGGAAAGLHVEVNRAPSPQASVPGIDCSSPAIHTRRTAREPAAVTGTAFRLKRESGRRRASEPRSRW